MSCECDFSGPIEDSFSEEFVDLLIGVQRDEGMSYACEYVFIVVSPDEVGEYFWFVEYIHFAHVFVIVLLSCVVGVVCG